MSIKVGQAFERTSAQPIDVTLTLTKADMLTINDNLMPAYYFTICQDDGKIYLYDKTATASATTGKFKKFDGGSGGGVEIYDTTDTLSSEINGTKVVLAADLPGVSFSDLVVGSSIIKDAKGTLGIVTTITGTTSVTVTTATTSTPTMELTQAQYDALTPAQQNNGTIYFVTDAPSASYYIGAYDTVHTDQERVVGSYMGKPLYQKTVYVNSGFTNPTNLDSSLNTTDVSIVDLEGSVKFGNQYITFLNRANTQSINFQMEVYSSDTGLLFYYGSSISGINWVSVTVRYTKTTDPTSAVRYAHPNDYSTSEQIVGTWIDGKPLYQKTYNLMTPSSTGVTTILTDASLATVSIKEMHGFVDGPNKAGANTFPGADVNRPCATTYLSGQETGFWIRNNGELAMELNYAGACNIPFYLTIKYTKNS